MINSAFILYSRHIKGLSVSDALDGKFPLVGSSCFSDGAIEIDEQGNFHCKESGKRGTHEEFLRLLYPFLTDRGAKEAVYLESRDIPGISITEYEKNMALKSSKEYSTEFKFLCNISPPKSNYLFLESQSQSMFGYDLSDIGQPLCRTTWQLGSRKDSLLGVPRIKEAIEVNRIYFVENFLEKVLLEALIDQPVYVRPNTLTLEWNNYALLVQGKEVICLMGDERGDWMDSFHPFLRVASRTANSIKTIYIPPLSSGRSLAEYVGHNRAIDSILRLVEHSKQEPTLLDKTSYRNFIHTPRSNSLYFPQGFGAGHFWYGTSDGDFLHSEPINLVSVKELEEQFDLQSSPYPGPNIKLSKPELLNIVSSIKQLTPLATFLQLRSYFLKYVYFTHDEFATLLALWVMGSYVYQLFNAYPYLHLHGGFATGKTTIMDIIELTAFNGISESQATKAKLIEVIHRSGATIILDEFEKNSKGTEDQYTQMLKAGYRKGGSYSKMTAKNQESKFNIYSPKVLGGESEIVNSALKSRTIEIKTTSKPNGINLADWDKDDVIHQQPLSIIRRGGYSLGLMNHNHIRQNYNRITSEIELPSGEKLSARKRQLASPLLAIAQLIDVNQSSPWVEEELLKALDICFFESSSTHATAEKLLFNLLEQWNSDPSSINYKFKDEYLWIHNESWINTSLAKHFGTKDRVLAWFERLPGVIKKSENMPSIGTVGTTAFPLNLKINKMTIGETFIRKSP